MNKVFKEDKIWFHKSNEGCRWWFHWGNTCWHYEGYLFKKAHHNSISLRLGGDENDFTVNLGIKGLFNFYFGVEDFFPRKIMKKLFDYTTRYYGVSLFEEYISIEFHRDDMGYGKGWRGYHKMIDWKSIIFGKDTHEKKELSTERSVIKMPEGDYPATIKISQSTWTRKRIVKPIVRTRYEITPDIPIPEPGKGENGWDMDDDAIFNSTVTANSLEEALNKVRDSVMKTRKNRASVNWKPDGGFKIQQPK